MSIETDVSAIKRDVQQLSRTSSDFKRDIQKRLAWLTIAHNNTLPVYFGLFL